MKAFIFDRDGNAIATDIIRDVVRNADDGTIGIYVGRVFVAAQDTVEGVVAAIRQAEIEATYADEYWRCEARYAFNHGRPAQ